jgi:hypothetical protein
MIMRTLYIALIPVLFWAGICFSQEESLAKLMSALKEKIDDR